MTEGQTNFRPQTSPPRPGARFWLHRLLCALILLPTAFTPDSLRYLAQNLPSGEEESGLPFRAPVNEDDLDETAKVSSCPTSARRIIRLVRSSLHETSGDANVASRAASATALPTLPPPAGCEHAFRNGLGTALRI